MRTLISALICLFVAASLMACGSEDGQEPLEGSLLADVRPAAVQEAPEAVEVEPTDEIVTAQLEEESQVPEFTGAIVALAKVGETLYAAGDPGLATRAGDEVTRVSQERVVAVLTQGEQVWIAEEGMLKTADGSTEIVPEFAAALTALAASESALFVGTAGEGVWSLVNGSLTPVSPDWDVQALVATEFGLFASTDVGLFSYDGDRWHRRSLGDSSDALTAVDALYYRYPYLYVGAEGELLRFDGGGWERFALNPELAVTALGWHNARLYIGGAGGELLTLEGTVLETVAAPQAGTISAILRFDGRLHLGTEDGLYRKRYTRFEKLDLEEPGANKPETEPIASLL